VLARLSAPREETQCKAFGTGLDWIGLDWLRKSFVKQHGSRSRAPSSPAPLPVSRIWRSVCGKGRSPLFNVCANQDAIPLALGDVAKVSVLSVRPISCSTSSAMTDCAVKSVTAACHYRNLANLVGKRVPCGRDSNASPLHCVALRPRVGRFAVCR
jgi:hypothetical protein